MSLENHFSQPYFEVHPGNGPYLLLVHGLLSCHAQWMLNIPVLSKVTRPVVVELLGHGRSPAPESPDAYRPEKYIEAFENIRKRLNVEKWLICGQSLGTGLTFRYALDMPQRIIGHIFTNATSSFREQKEVSDSAEETRQMATKLLEQGPEGIKRIPVHPANARRLRADVKAALVEGCSNGSVLGVVNALRYTRPELSVRNRLGENKVPSLLVCGKRENRFLPFRDFAREHMPMLEIVNLDAGHAVNIEAAEEFNKSVCAFVKKQYP